MVYYVHLDPRVIEEAFANRPYGFQCLMAMLRGFMQNCCLIDWGGECRGVLKAQVDRLPNGADRWSLKEALKHLDRHHRFVRLPARRSIEDLSDLLEEASNAEVDLVVTSEPRDGITPPRGIEVCSLLDYQSTIFEHRRALKAQGGATYRHGQLDGSEFLSTNFAKALRHAEYLEICDGQLGRHFGDNYRYTIEAFLDWLQGPLENVRNDCPVSILCLESSDGNEELSSFLSDQGVKLKLYRKLPHERFLRSDQFAMEVGRGMDFLLPRNDRNRDVSIATKNHREVTILFQAYGRWCVTPP